MFPLTAELSRFERSAFLSRSNIQLAKKIKSQILQLMLALAGRLWVLPGGCKDPKHQQTFGVVGFQQKHALWKGENTGFHTGESTPRSDNAHDVQTLGKKSRQTQNNRAAATKKRAAASIQTEQRECLWRNESLETLEPDAEFRKPLFPKHGRSG